MLLVVLKFQLKHSFRLESYLVSKNGLRGYSNRNEIYPLTIDSMYTVPDLSPAESIATQSSALVQMVFLVDGTVACLQTHHPDRCPSFHPVFVQEKVSVGSPCAQL